MTIMSKINKIIWKHTKIIPIIALKEPLLSTGNCKISDFMEENLKRGLEIKFFPGSPIQFMLNFTDKSISQR